MHRQRRVLVGRGRLQPLDQRQLRRQRDAQAQDRADEIADQISSSRSCEATRREVIAMVGRFSDGRGGSPPSAPRTISPVSMVRTRAAIASASRIGISTGSSPQAGAQPVDAVAAGAGADGVDREEGVDARRRVAAATISSGVSPTISHLVGADLVLRQHQLEQVDIARGIAHHADPRPRRSAMRPMPLSLRGDEEGEGAAGDQRRVGLGRQGDVGPDDGELGLALVDLAGRSRPSPPSAPA